MKAYAALLLPLTLAACTSVVTPTPTSTNPDTLFEQAATGGNLFEIQTSQLALTNSTSANVKAFAQQMITDHTTAQAKLNTLATAQGVTLPTALPPDKQLQVVTLSKLSGSAFDTAYIQAQITGHQSEVTVFQTEIDTGTNTDTKAFATTLLPVIQMHLTMAQALKP